MDPLHNEKQLLFQVSQGDEEAFEKIYHFYSSKLYYKLLKVVKAKLHAEELLQNVFLKIWNNRQNLNGEKSFGSYLYCIAANACYDFFRKTSRDKKFRTQFLKLFATKYSHIEEALIKKESSEILNQAINSLPQKRKQIFILCKFDGKSYREVSHQLGISPSTISDHIVKANHFIRAYFMRRMI
jgi:RNA polymerase sigma-70 factor (ECF subfamily)